LIEKGAKRLNIVEGVRPPAIRPNLGLGALAIQRQLAQIPVVYADKFRGLSRRKTAQRLSRFGREKLFAMSLQLG